VGRRADGRLLSQCPRNSRNGPDVPSAFCTRSRLRTGCQGHPVEPEFGVQESKGRVTPRPPQSWTTAATGQAGDREATKECWGLRRHRGGFKPRLMERFRLRGPRGLAEMARWGRARAADELAAGSR